MPINESERGKLIEELEDFRDDFMKYGRLVLLEKKGHKLIASDQQELRSLWAESPVRYGSIKGDIEKYGGVALVTLQGGKRDYEAFTSSFNYTPFHHSALQALIAKAIITINMALGKLKSLPSPIIEPQNDGVVQSPKAFIAHGGQSACLKKLCAFLKALGVDPVVAEWSESEGRWTEEHVNKRMEDSDCYIILAEYGCIVDIKTGAKHPRLNVIDELARSRKIRPGRIALLLQKGVSLPSNVSGIVYEHFTKQNMEKAFIKVASELRAFGLIKATKECK